ncbi:VSP protein [Hibiscus syriacus]|uniref:VSP protein n=1 Tax=Hibiscus syriacus TaxID=106335 RepID=A0A6A2YPU8_HIBSY|nr:VSP protein [Hibiscus syriacus]
MWSRRRETRLWRCMRREGTLTKGVVARDETLARVLKTLAFWQCGCGESSLERSCGPCSTPTFPTTPHHLVGGQKEKSDEKKNRNEKGRKKARLGKRGHLIDYTSSPSILTSKPLIWNRLLCLEKASAYMRKGILNEAAQCFHQALQLNPLLVDAHSDRGNLMKAQGLMNSPSSKLYSNGGVALSALDDLAIHHGCSRKAMEKATHKRQSVSCIFPVSGPQGDGVLQLKAVRNKALRPIEFLRGVCPLTKECRVVKLFSKIDEHVGHTIKNCFIFKIIVQKMRNKNWIDFNNLRASKLAQRNHLKNYDQLRPIKRSHFLRQHLQYSSRQEGLFANQRPSSSTTLSSKAHHLQYSLSREGLSAKDPRVRLHSASRAHHLQHNSRLEGLSVAKIPSSSTTLSSKAHHLQYNLSREGLSAEDPRVRLHSASREHHLQHNSRLEGLSVTKIPLSSTTLSSKAHHLHREGLSANQRPLSSTTPSSKVHHLQHSSRQEGLFANQRPSSLTTLSSEAHHLQHILSREGLSANQRHDEFDFIQLDDSDKLLSGRIFKPKSLNREEDKGPIPGSSITFEKTGQKLVAFDLESSSFLGIVPRSGHDSHEVDEDMCLALAHQMVLWKYGKCLEGKSKCLHAKMNIKRGCTVLPSSTAIKSSFGDVALSALEDLAIHHGCSRKAMEKVTHKRQSISCIFPVSGPQGDGVLQLKAVRNKTLRPIEFLRGMCPLTKECRVVKLFSKIDEHVGTLLYSEPQVLNATGFSLYCYSL